MVEGDLQVSGDPTIDAFRRTIDACFAAAGGVYGSAFRQTLVDSVAAQIPKDDMDLILLPTDRAGETSARIVYGPAHRRHMAFAAEYMRLMFAKVHEIPPPSNAETVPSDG